MLGRACVPPGGHEITGTLVTGDALHLHAETAALVRERGGEWLFALKARRPAILAEIKRCFADPASPITAHTTDADRGRIETRPTPSRPTSPGSSPNRAGGTPTTHSSRAWPLWP